MAKKMSRRYQGLGADWTRKTLVRRDGARCALCAEAFASMRDITIDHRLARSRGGSDELSNLQLTHERCNSWKGDLTVEQWRLLQFGADTAG